MRYFTTDFETTTDIDDCRVWAWGAYSIAEKLFEYDNDIESFFGWCVKNHGSTLFFHNLKFDGEFIIHWLLSHGYSHITDKQDIATKTFETLITDSGVFYSIKIYFEVKGKKRIQITMLDSLKILPMSIKSMAQSFAMEQSKLEIDYNEKREIGHELTEQEIEYLHADVEIAATAIKYFLDMELDKMTLASNAMLDYKRGVGKNFGKWFPILDYDRDLRAAYKGGFTYLKEEYANKIIGDGIVLDVNSLYPWVLRKCPLPYGNGVFFNGKYKSDKSHPLYIQMFSCEFKIKPNHIPTIQLKGNSRFSQNEYIKDSNGEVELCLTSIDVQLFFEHYDVTNIIYSCGWKFRQTIGMFSTYVDKWVETKNKATIENNAGLRSLAKLLLNSLYGKFALNPNVQSKIPYLDEVSGRVCYRLGAKETRKPIYVPVSIFVTAHARYKTITSAQKHYDRFIYADTDSLHLLGTELPPDLEIDKVKLGAWKHEATFEQAKFIRQKTYLEVINGKLNVVCAGMPHKLHDQVTIANFEEGSNYSGKLTPKHVRGGVVLLPAIFTIKSGKGIAINP